MHEDAIRTEFAHQTETFAKAAPMRSEVALGSLVELVPEDPGARWLELACGPGLISRTIAPRVGSVHGVDLTPAMIERGRADALADGLENVEFSLGDATALELADASFDGAITRFSLHHIPTPQRVMEEMARVVRPGGLVVVGDHVANEDRDPYAWVEEIERLRDPSHWACLTPARIRAVGAAAGLELEHEELIPFELEFGPWLERGSGGAASAALVDRLLSEAPAGSEAFRVSGEGSKRRLHLQYLVCRWRRP